MRATVKKMFVDTDTKKLYTIGDSYNGDKERVDTLKKLGYVTVAESIKKESVVEDVRED